MKHRRPYHEFNERFWKNYFFSIAFWAAVVGASMLMINIFSCHVH